MSLQFESKYDSKNYFVLSVRWESLCFCPSAKPSREAYVEGLVLNYSSSIVNPLALLH